MKCQLISSVRCRGNGFPTNHIRSSSSCKHNKKLISYFNYYMNMCMCSSAWPVHLHMVFSKFYVQCSDHTYMYIKTQFDSLPYRLVILCSGGYSSFSSDGRGLKNSRTWGTLVIRSGRDISSLGDVRGGGGGEIERLLLLDTYNCIN